MIILSIFITGCAVEPKHYYGTENIPANELTRFSYSEGEILIISVDGQPFLGKDWEEVYLQPGAHEFVVKLNWSNTFSVSSMFISTTNTSHLIKRGCIDMKAGKNYHLMAKEPGENWRFVVWETSKSIYDYTIDVPECK